MELETTAVEKTELEQAVDLVNEMVRLDTLVNIVGDHLFVTRERARELCIAGLSNVICPEKSPRDNLDTIYIDIRHEFSAKNGGRPGGSTTSITIKV